MKTFRKLLEKSSIGGLSYISTSETKVEKLFWLLVVLTSISVTTFLTTQAIVNWSKYPVATTIESFPISEVPFPKITVCPPKVAFSFTSRIFRQAIYDFVSLGPVMCCLYLCLCLFVLGHEGILGYESIK